MRRSIRGLIPVSLILTLFVGVGCSTSKQAKEVNKEERGVLTQQDWEKLQPGNEEKGEALFVFKDKDVDWKKYKDIMIEPVTFLVPSDTDEDDVKDLQKLANNADIFLHRELGHDLPIVKQPGPNTLRVKMYVFNAEKKKVALNAVSSVLPVGVVVSATKDFVTGKPSATGEVSAQMKFDDADTGTLVAAAQDKRVGQKYSEGTFDSWADANHAVEYWAKRARFTLCELQAKASCVDPQA